MVELVHKCIQQLYLLALHFEILGYIPGLLNGLEYLRRTGDFSGDNKSIYPVILIIQEKKNAKKMQKCKKKKKKNENLKNSQYESIQISLCFSHYKHHTDIKQPKLSTVVRLI